MSHEHAYAPHALTRLLRARRERPRRRAAEQRDELATIYLIELHRHPTSRERTRQNIELTGISQPSAWPD
jgi:hypothetical protein